jgi:hypothetical protein
LESLFQNEKILSFIDKFSLVADEIYHQSFTVIEINVFVRGTKSIRQAKNTHVVESCQISAIATLNTLEFDNIVVLLVETSPVILAPFVEDIALIRIVFE